MTATMIGQLIDSMPASHNAKLIVRERHNSLDCDRCEEGCYLDSDLEVLMDFIESHAHCGETAEV